MDFELTSALAVLERTPGALRTLLEGLDDEWTRADEGPDTFSPFDVVGHLIDAEETNWVPRARVILARDPAVGLPGFDRFRHRERNRTRDLASLLDEFASLRGANLELVRSWHLTPELLALTSDHPDLGRVALRQLLATWVVHDLGHLAQVSRVMAKQYRDAIGPWADYLPVVTDRQRPATEEHVR